jgi:hypothetical protein
MNYNNIMQGQAGNRIVCTFICKDSKHGGTDTRLSSHYANNEEIAQKARELRTDYKHVSLSIER